VKSILVNDGKAEGVELADGMRIATRRAVIANVTPRVLARLVRGDGRIDSAARRYKHGPGTMMIHLAMADLPAWRDARAREFPYVHVAPSLDALSDAYECARTGRFPEHPLLVVAQPTVADPSRAPAGRHVLSIQVRAVPENAREQDADRVLALLERYAPGLRERVLGRAVLTPESLERANPNLAGGDNISGTHQLARSTFSSRGSAGRATVRRSPTSTSAARRRGRAPAAAPGRDGCSADC